MEHGHLMLKLRDLTVTWLRIIDISSGRILYLGGDESRSCKITMMQLVYS